MTRDMMDSNITGIEPNVAECMWEAAKIGVDFKNFAQSFSKTQLESKTWLVDVLSLMNIDEARIQLFGGWHGILITRLLIENLNVRRIHNIDLDEKAIKVFKKYRWETQDRRLDGTHGDVRTPHKYDYMMNIVINTSSEHMPDLPELIKDKKYPSDCLFALQSNNMFHIDDHINCVSSEQELVDKSKLNTIKYQGTCDMANGYKRFMVIGYA